MIDIGTNPLMIRFMYVRYTWKSEQYEVDISEVKKIINPIPELSDPPNLMTIFHNI